MFTLEHINIKDLDTFVKDPASHIASLVATFELAYQKNGPDNFIPMAIFFSNPSTISFSIEAIPYDDKNDMYKILNEILQFFSASEAYSLIFAMDIRQTTYHENDPSSKSQSSTDALSLSFVSEDSSGVLVMPYSIIDKNINWDSSNFSITNMAEENPSKKYQGDLPELFYLMTHLDGPIFTTAQLLNYYSYKGYQFMIPENSVVKSIKVVYNEN